MTDLIADFDAALAPTVSDPLFRRWGGAMLTSALLGRHAWTTIKQGQPLYPHLYAMLVAGSGFGKSQTIKAVRECLVPWTKAGPGPADPPRVRFAAKNITFPRLIRELGNAFPAVPKSLGGNLLRVKCYALLADEIGVLLGDKANVSDLQQLASIWDMDKVYDKQTVRDERDKRETSALDHYMVAMLGAQPAWIAEALPLGRFQLGFPARTHFVLGKVKSDQGVDFSPAGVTFEDTIRAAVDAGAQQVTALKGLFTWEQRAQDAIVDWVRAGQPGRGGTVREWTGLLDGYGNRRREHAAKLATVFAASRGETEIALGDWEAGLGLLLDTEDDMDDVLELVGANPQRVREDQVLQWVRAQGGEVPEAVLRAHMRAFFDTRTIGWTIDELLAAKLLVDVANRAAPHRRFVVG